MPDKFDWHSQCSMLQMIPYILVVMIRTSKPRNFVVMTSLDLVHDINLRSKVLILSPVCDKLFLTMVEGRLFGPYPDKVSHMTHTD